MGLFDVFKKKKNITFADIDSMDKARKEIAPIVKEMKTAKREKREPTIRIDGASYDTNSEKSLLLELDAIVSTENESERNY